MPGFIRERNDLIFDRRAVPRTNSFDLPAEERRSRNVVTNDLVSFLGCVGDVTRNLSAIDPGRHERERSRLGISMLRLKA